jgi:hypothetical protein
MNKIFLSSILLLVVLVGCNVQVTDSITNKTKSINTGSKANIYEKYSYDCNNLGDHSKHDYALQQELTTQCQKKCCNGNYCEECSWPEYGDCYTKCESDSPEGMCVNCDGFCWGKGHLDFLNTKIRLC